VEFRVTNMSCGHCKMTIENVLRDLGVSSFAVNLEQKTVRVDSNEVSEKAVKQAIQAKGYDIA